MNDALYWLTLTLAILGAWETYGFPVSLIIDHREGYHTVLMPTTTAELRCQILQPHRCIIRRLTPVMVVIG